MSFYLHTRQIAKQPGQKRKRGWTKKIDRYQKLRVDLSVRMEGLARVIQGSWWEWDYRSTLFFWRWLLQIRNSARDGLPVFTQQALPTIRRKQSQPDKEYMLIKMKEKLGK